MNGNRAACRLFLVALAAIVALVALGLVAVAVVLAGLPVVPVAVAVVRLTGSLVMPVARPAVLVSRLAAVVRAPRADRIARRWRCRR